MNQDTHDTPEAAELRQVEKLLHGAMSWEPDAPPPADLCARVAERIAGRSPRRPVRRVPKLAYVPMGLAASGAFVWAVFAMVVPGRLLHIPETVAPTVVTGTSQPPSASSLPDVAPAGNGGMQLATYQEEPAPSMLMPSVAPTPQVTERPAARRRRRAYLPERRNRVQYAGSNRMTTPKVLPTHEQPKILAEGPYPQELGTQGEMVALVPVVLADYEQPESDDSTTPAKATFTPAVVAVSLKPDAFGEAAPTQPTETPLPTPVPTETPVPESPTPNTPTPESPVPGSPMPTPSPSPAPTEQPQ